MTTVHLWGGEEWETHINALLSLRYPPGEYQRVPAGHGGDCGIEGFSIKDGKAYQCYAPAEPLPVRELHERQRNKMTADIKKFIANRERLQKLLGNVKVSRWLLVVPEHKSAHLVAHCVEKTKEVVHAKLPYVTDDFRVVVITDDEFALERRALTSHGAAHVKLDAIVVDPQAVDAFASINATGMTNLTRKVAVALEGDTDEARQDLIQHLVHSYLVGQSHLERLHRSYPEVHAQLLALVARAETRIAFDSKVTPLSASEFLARQYDALHSRLLSEVQSAALIADDLVLQVIADWLMRCPLDFRKAKSPAVAGVTT